MRLLLLTLISVGLLFGCDDGLQTWPNVRYDPKKWNDTREDGRFIFVRDLIENKRLIGKTRAEVHTMLGKPESEEIADRMVYYVKQGKTDLYFLDVRFNTDNPRRVDEAFIRSD